MKDTVSKEPLGTEILMETHRYISLPHKIMIQPLYNNNNNNNNNKPLMLFFFSMSGN